MRPVPEKWLNFDGAAEYMGVTPRWMRQAVLDKRIPYTKLGLNVRFDRADLDAYLAAARVDAKVGLLAAQGGDKPSAKPTR